MPITLTVDSISHAVALCVESLECVAVINKLEGVIDTAKAYRPVIGAIVGVHEFV